MSQWTLIIRQLQGLSELQTVRSGGAGDAELIARGLKLSEESGELAQALLGITGNINASKSGLKLTQEEAMEEAIDVIINAFDISFRLGGDTERIQDALKRKMEKWQAKLERA
jgi:NTP pyrophosphatase (non-canonical NTP hydrolase)